MRRRARELQAACPGGSAGCWDPALQERGLLANSAQMGLRRPVKADAHEADGMDVAQLEDRAQELAQPVLTVAATPTVDSQARDARGPGGPASRSGRWFGRDRLHSGSSGIPLGRFGLVESGGARAAGRNFGGEIPGTPRSRAGRAARNVPGSYARNIPTEVTLRSFPKEDDYP